MAIKQALSFEAEREAPGGLYQGGPCDSVEPVREAPAYTAQVMLPSLVRWLLVFALTCPVLVKGADVRGTDGLEVSMIPPFEAVPASGWFEAALVFKNCSDHAVLLQAGPSIYFFRSAAGLADVEQSGPVEIPRVLDWPEEKRREPPLALQLGEQAHVALGYYSRGEHPQVYDQSVVPACRDVDVLAVNQPPLARLFPVRMHVCSEVYESVYRRGNFVRGEPIMPGRAAACGVRWSGLCTCRGTRAGLLQHGQQPYDQFGNGALAGGRCHAVGQRELPGAVRCSDWAADSHRGYLLQSTPNRAGTVLIVNEASLPLS